MIEWQTSKRRLFSFGPSRLSLLLAGLALAGACVALAIVFLGRL